MFCLFWITCHQPKETAWYSLNSTCLRAGILGPHFLRLVSLTSPACWESSCPAPECFFLLERWSEDERPSSGALPGPSSRRKQAFLATVHNGPQPEPASLAASASLLASAPISSSVAWPAPKTATSPLFSLMASQFPELLFLNSRSPCCYFFCPNQNFMEPCLPFVPCILGPHLSHFSTWHWMLQTWKLPKRLFL